MQRQVIAALAACVVLFPTFVLAETKSLEVAQFHGVDASSGIHAIVSGGKPHSVVVDASDPQALNDLRFEVRDSVLRVWYDWNILDLLSQPQRDVTITVETEVLDRLEASAGASIEADALMGEDIGLEASSGASIKTTAIQGMSYSIESSSGAHIETSGFCTTAEIEVSSGASVSAKDLDCGKVTLEVSSGASLEVTAKDTISAEVSSGGHAIVHGKPSVEHLETSSGGSVDFPS
jgi:hypothetical protein